MKPSLPENLAHLKAIFRECSDLVIHDIAPERGPKGCLAYMNGMADRTTMDRDILGPLLTRETTADLAQIAAAHTPLGHVQQLATFGEVTNGLLSGQAVLLIDGATGALGYGARHLNTRAVEEPVTEAAIRGPREGFVEALGVNIVLLRRKIKTPALKTVRLKIGRITQTDVVVSYVEGLANPEVVREVLTRLKRIDVDGILEGGYLEEFIEDSPLSPFPQIQNTERPDTAAAQLLEGRVVILTDGTPFVLCVPVVFATFMQAGEDYYERFLLSSLIRALRYSFLFVALLLPSLYIGITTFHPEMIPTNLLITVAAAREGIPFPALVEALIMEISFEILREAGVRLPRTVGQAVSIVGALVIGEAAVQAGLASAPMVIIVSATGIASFAIPRYSAGLAIRMLRFPLMFLAGTLGLFGIVLGLAAILFHLCSLRSFGIPYLDPVAPLNWRGLTDTIIRAPRWWMRFRPRLIGHANPVRTGSGLRPGAHQRPERGK